MTDLISKQAAIDAINEIRGTMNMVTDIVVDKYLIIAQDNIRLLPPVQPEQKKGKWIFLDECSNSGYYCSECNKKVVKEGWSNTVKKIKFCPNCGEDMRGEQNG